MFVRGDRTGIYKSYCHHYSEQTVKERVKKLAYDCSLSMISIAHLIKEIKHMRACYSLYRSSSAAAIVQKIQALDRSILVDSRGLFPAIVATRPRTSKRRVYTDRMPNLSTCCLWLAAAVI
jgi:hypothetical protein